jgi:hypothetical protein
LASTPFQIYGSDDEAPKPDEKGNDVTMIDAFWGNLFLNMGLQRVQRKSHSNVTEYKFFQKQD